MSDRHPTPEQPRPPRFERWVLSLAGFSASNLALILAGTLAMLWFAALAAAAATLELHDLMFHLSGIVVFLMVFVLQRSQTKDTLALQIKLNELLAATPRASNRLLNVESIPEDELRALQQRFVALTGTPGSPLSIDDEIDDEMVSPTEH